MKPAWMVLALVLGSGLAGAQDAPPEGTPASGKKAAPKRPAAPDIAHMPFTPDSVREVMQYYAHDIQECYEEILATKGSKVEEGKLLTTFVITPEGTVRNAKVAKAGTTLKNKRLNECVVNVLLGMTFPAPPDKREYPIEYPFNLKALK